MSDISKEEMVFLLKDVIKLQLANESVIDIHSSKSARTSSSIIVLGVFGIFGFLSDSKQRQKSGKIPINIFLLFSGKSPKSPKNILVILVTFKVIEKS